ncbi:Cu/Ag efflux protein CusF [Bradyrhizobium sp. USDA 3240]
MRAILCLSCVSLLTLTMAFAAAQETHRGTIVSVDEPTGSITVQQSPSAPPAAGDSARSPKTFAVQDGLLFNALRAGDRVAFSSKEIKGTNTITQLQRE